MPLFGRRSDPIKVDETSYKGWLGSLKGELAGAKSDAKAERTRTETQAAGTSRSYSRTVTRAADRWVAEEGERLESSRPSGRTRRSPDPDRGGFFGGGIFAARKPDAGGRIPYERWPSETQPRGGCSIPGCTCGR